MAKRSKSKNLLKDDATYKASNSSEQDDADSDLEARETSPSMDNDAGDKEAKTDKKSTNKRRKTDMSCISSEHSQAVEVVVANEDLLREILFHVPAKSLLKFKSVSKHWRSLISDSLFASNHACRNSSSSLISGLYFYQLKSVSLHGHLSLPTPAFLDSIREGSESRVVDSCNGLLLFSNGGKMKYIVCNPTTQKYIALPQHGGSTSYSSTWGFGAYFAFDPSKSPYYKVVLVSCHSRSYQIYIHSSKSASWKEMHVKPPNGGSVGCKVFWNGAIHWTSHANVHNRFDIDAENLTSMPMFLGKDEIWYFGECGGSLLRIQTVYPSLGFRVLEMKKDCCRWIVKHQFSVKPIHSVHPKGYRTGVPKKGYRAKCGVLWPIKIKEYKVLCCVNGANEKDFTVAFVITGKVISYNLNGKTVKVLLENLKISPYSFFNLHAL
ncbi:F-box protein At5g07610-like isoform X2 [Rhododendron vialii]|uniref:F-box protein At5g07610-like isoform X2 n=1 Tax=Rhododendron vialii TaxID=182163 RepID=UPI0026603919|nr:F-box protein At5g07610-like isoform X2 [Rhododendron vialii]